ncbi:Neuromedin-U receptor 2, partial [Lamellibrachia satsuma]
DIITTAPTVPQPPVYVFVTVTLIYTLLFVLGVAGNLLVFIVVWRHPDMRSSTNCFIVNLSVADTLVIIVCMPTSLIELYSKNVWHLGPVMCKLVPFLENTVALSSVLTILAIGFERYHAICRPLLARYKCTFRHMLKIVLAIWFIASVACVPFLIITVHRDSAFIDGTPIKVCRISVRRPWQRVYIMCITAVFFVFPMIFLSGLYTVISRQLMRDSKLATMRHDSNGLSNIRARKQVVFMLAAIVCLFFACLLPMNALRLWSLFRNAADLRRLGFEAFLNIVYFARVLFFTNSVINPVCYTMFSTKFREAFWRLTTRREALRSV